MTYRKTLLMLSAVLASSLQLAACGSSADRKAAYVARGEQYMAQDNHQKARVEFRNALQIDPKDARLHVLAGRAAEKLGEYREAAGQYQAAVDLDGSDAEARAALGRLFAVGGAPDRALEVIAPGLEKHPGHGELLTVRAAAKASKGDVAGSRADAEAAYEAAPGNDYTITLLASLYKRDGQTSQALELVRGGVQRLPGNVDLRIVLADLEFEAKRPAEAERHLRKAIELDPRNLNHRYFLARFFLLDGNVAGAEQVLRDAVASDPTSVHTRTGLVEFLAEHRGAVPAEEELRRMVKADPGNTELQLALGSFLTRHQRADQAREVYEALVASQKLEPAGLAARSRLAEMALARNDRQTAERLIGEVLGESATNADALTLRAQLAMSRGDPMAAITDLRTVLRDQPDAVNVLRTLARAHVQNGEPALAEEALRSATQAQPQSVEARLELAQLLMQAQKVELARPILNQLGKEAPGNLVVQESLFRAQLAQKDFLAAEALALTLQGSQQELAIGHYFAGLVHEQQQNPVQAAKDYERALGLQPQAAEPLAALVRMDLAAKRPAQALARLDATIAASPDNLHARNLKGETLMMQKQYAQSARTYEEALERNPKLASFYSRLAAAQLADKREEAAAATLRKGIAASDEPVAIATDLAQFHERRGQIDDAVAAYEAALAREPDEQNAVNNLAMLLVSHRQQDEASRARALSLAEKLEGSRNPVFMDTLGWVYLKNGRVQEALPLLQQAVAKAPDAPALRFHLAIAQQQSGNATDAMSNLTKALEAKRAFEGIEEARAALRTLQARPS